MKLKEALPDFSDTFWDRRQKQKPAKVSSVPPPVLQRKDLEITTDKTNDGFYRATIKSIKGERYGTKPYHPKDFIASGRTPDEAKEELFKKLKL